MLFKPETKYELLELVSKWEILSFYVRSILNGLFVILKWIITYLWQTVHQQKNSLLDNKDVHDKPPSFLINSKFGRHSYIKLRGVKLHYVESGHKNDPVVVLLHGFPDCWFGWRYQIKELSRFFRVIALDLKGFNDSDKPIWRQEYTPKKICAELALFIQSLNVNSVTIIGHDLGGVIGWTLAHTNPEIVNRFICISAPHPNLVWQNLGNNKKYINTSWLNFVQLPYIPEVEQSRLDSNFLTNNLYHVEKKSSNKIDQYEDNSNDTDWHILDAYRYVFSRKNDWTGPLNYFRNLPFYRINETAMISCPCLIVSGNEDPLYRLESMIKSTDYCDNFIVKIIEGAGHWPHQQMAEEFNRILLKFLVGRRASQSYDKTSDKLNNKGLMGYMLGAVSNSVNKIHNHVQLKTSDVIHNVLN